MAKLFRLEMYTPERLFLTDDVEAVRVDAPDGSWMVLADHAPMVLMMVPGEVGIKKNDQYAFAFCSEAFMEVRPDKTLIFAQEVEWMEDIDTYRAEQQKEQSEEALAQELGMREYHMQQVNLARAMARLRVIGRGKSLD